MSGIPDKTLWAKINASDHTEHAEATACRIEVANWLNTHADDAEMLAEWTDGAFRYGDESYLWMQLCGDLIEEEMRNEPNWRVNVCRTMGQLWDCEPNPERDARRAAAHAEWEVENAALAEVKV